jgi:hypothetical protein
MRIKDIEENEKLTDFLYKDIVEDFNVLNILIIETLYEITDIIMTKKDIE